MKLIELKSRVSLSLKSLECRDGKTCPKETVNEFGVCWEIGKGDNSPVSEKGASSFFLEIRCSDLAHDLYQILN